MAYINWKVVSGVLTIALLVTFGLFLMSLANQDINEKANHMSQCVGRHAPTSDYVYLRKLDLCIHKEALGGHLGER